MGAPLPRWCRPAFGANWADWDEVHRGHIERQHGPAAIERKRAEQRGKAAKHAEAAKAERERLRKEFAERQVEPRAPDLIASLIDKAVEGSVALSRLW
jgi:hypothetical protein